MFVRWHSCFWYMLALLFANGCPRSTVCSTRGSTVRMLGVFRRNPDAWTLFLGFLIHLSFLSSVFDVYFTTPIVQGVPSLPHPWERSEFYGGGGFEPAARRLVLFVADGLRADTFFSYEGGKPFAPFLRNVVEKRGVWGVSHTRVPTESRPGHVAIIAGIYEDPSAVAKGWKENPVEFDSVFNRSTATFAWGSPDILPMFAKSTPQMLWQCYDSNKQDFGGSKDASELDLWVFNRFEHFIMSNAQNKILQEEGIVFFLHLLGLDTNGHTHRPGSKEYKDNLRTVDSLVKKTEEIMERFYRDGKTAYVFTSDHGMTDWGSHGSGDPSETETPLVAWGSGVRGPRYIDDSNALSGLLTPSNWKLSHLVRSDVEQADIAPLMSGLLDITFPVNSIGRLPLDYLGVPPDQQAALAFLNARQVAEQFRQRKKIHEQGSIRLLDHPYLPLDHRGIDKLHIEIRKHLQFKEYKLAIQKSKQLLFESLDGLDYYHRYHQRSLTVAVTLSFLGWTTYLVGVLLKDSGLDDTGKSIDNQRMEFGTAQTGLAKYMTCCDSMFAGLATLVVILLFVQHSPFSYYVYFLLPVILWRAVLRERKMYVHAFESIFYGTTPLKLLSTVIVYAIGIEILVLSFFHRWSLCFGLLGMAMWPYFSGQSHSIWVSLLWTFSCIGLACFPLLPVVGRESNPELVGFIGWCVLICGGLACRHPVFRLAGRDRLRPRESTRVQLATLLQIAVIPLSIWTARGTSQSLLSRTEVATLHHLASWICLLLSSITPLLGSLWMAPRLLQISLAAFPPFLLLSSSYEGLFYLTICVAMGCWVMLEEKGVNLPRIHLKDVRFDATKESRKKYRVTGQDLRRAYFFLFFIMLSFFGTGNIASVNSYDPSVVRSFVTVFSPFVMGALLLVKVIIPFLLVTCAFRAITFTLQIPVSRLFVMVLILSDVCGLHFFYMVTNKGSWLDIGTSISHFVIVQATVLFLCILYGYAKLLTSDSLWPLLDTACQVILKSRKGVRQAEHMFPELGKLE